MENFKCKIPKDLKRLANKVYLGERLLDDVLDAMFKNEVSEKIKKAVKENAPIIIFDESGKGGDGLLYRALKNEGVTTVKNYGLMKTFEPMNENMAYFAIFLIEEVSFNSNLYENTQ